MKEEGMGIMYFGGAGAGKSYAAAQIVNALTDAGYDCLFTSFRNILTELGTLSNEGKRNYLNQLFRKDLLAFDEYGCEGEGNYNNQMVLYIISNCYQRHIPMLVTTPYHRESLVKSNNALRLQTLSRLWQRCCCIQVVAPPSRRHQTREQMNKTEALLKGPGPWYEEPDNYKEPCQEEKEKVQRKEDFNRRVAIVTDCVNEINSIERSLNDALTKISTSMGLFTIDSPSKTIQLHVNSIRNNRENVANSYEKGLQLQQIAKRESIGFERDDEMSQLVAEIDTTIRRVQEDYDTIQEKVTDAYQTLKIAQRRERRKKATIIISIIAILSLLVVVFLRK
jgi:hypothetical protein